MFPIKFICSFVESTMFERRAMCSLSIRAYRYALLILWISSWSFLKGPNKLELNQDVTLIRVQKEIISLITMIWIYFSPELILESDLAKINWLIPVPSVCWLPTNRHPSMFSERSFALHSNTVSTPFSNL